MDDVSGIADGSHKFAEFLTVCRKCRYHCIYGFHIVAPDSWVWKKCCHKQIFLIFFPQVCPATRLLKFYRAIVGKQQRKYVPVRSMWLSGAFADLANSDKWHCLTIDYNGINKNSPGKYWTQASDPKKEICYFNQLRDEEICNVFISNIIKAGNFSNGIYFKINQVQGKDETFDVEKTLKEDGAYNRFSKLGTVSKQPDFYGGSRKRGHEETSEHTIGGVTTARKSFLSGR